MKEYNMKKREKIRRAVVTETLEEFIEESVEGAKWMPFIHHRLLHFNIRTINNNSEKQFEPLRKYIEHLAQYIEPSRL